jgi:hypothetical protein
MKEQMDGVLLPFIYNHDPRQPPLGRVVGAEIRELEDGEHAIEAEVEVFEPGDELPFDSSRAVQYRSLPGDHLLLTIDRTFSGQQFAEPVSAIGELFGSSPAYEVKKALEPIAVLGIGLGAVTVGRFASSFFSKLGSNAADALSAKLKEVFRRAEANQVHLLRIEFEFLHDGRTCRAEIIATGPSDTDIDTVLNEGLLQLDHSLPSLLIPNVTRYVFEYANGKARLKFVVRSDSVPLFPSGNGEA